MSRRDTSFYYSFLVLTSERRRAIVAVWDFCRAVDDTVDEAAGGTNEEANLGGTTAALDAWRRELAACFDGGTLRTEQARRLQPYVARFNLPRQAFDAVIDGVAMDVSRRRFDTFNALREYCLRVASAVGLIAIEIFGYRDVRARAYAEDLGIALQLTNIIRDVAGDLERDRIYLPLEDLAQFGCAESDLRAGIMTDKLRALLKHECARARQWYRKAEANLPALDARRLVAARIMAAIYTDLLDRIERSGYDVFSQVIRAPRACRAMIAATTWARAMVGQ